MAASIWCGWWAVLAVALCAHARQPAQAPRPACARAAANKCQADRYNNRTFHVNGKRVQYEFTDGDFFGLKCPSTIALDEPALPRFEPALRVREVRLRCWPLNASYAAALRALNVIALDAPSPGELPAPPTYLIQLDLERVRNVDSHVLAALPTLRNLTISDSTVNVTDLALLPAGLERLALVFTGIGRVRADVLTRLPHLSELQVADGEPVTVEVAGNLSVLILESSAVSLVNLSLPDTLKTLSVTGWASRSPEPWSSCARLDALVLVNANAAALPDGWLGGCARLRTLNVEEAQNLVTVAAGALRGAAALEQVWFVRGALAALPAGLFDDARALRALHLEGNRLHTLPGELFKWCTSLSELTLSRNNLTGSVLGALEMLTSLQVLRLDHNPGLDACPRTRDTGGSLLLQDFNSLTLLALSHTATRRVCPAWRRLPRLARLELSYTAVPQLNYTDLQFNTTVDMTVELASSVGLSLRREDYERVAAALPGPTLTLELIDVPRCDCELYWAAAALRLDKRLREHHARCEGERALKYMPLEDLVCPARGACPAGCACAERDDVQRPGRVLRLDCTGAGLARVPRLDTRAVLLRNDSEPVTLDLRLTRNGIDRLAPDDVPPEVTTLDLRDNPLSVIDAATARALVSGENRRVWLARNPLDCSCRAAATLATMRDHYHVFQDWADATCADGTPLLLVAPRPCDDTGGPANGTKSEQNNLTENLVRYSSSRAPLSVPNESSGGMSAGAIAAVALGVMVAMGALALVVARAALRRRLRARTASTLRLQRSRPAAGEWLYDAFVSFAHADAGVVRALVARLEGGAAPLRLCVHYRDWAPGGWIPAQIAASVRVSRRTVAVVSESFLRSKWARAEFREAYAAALEDSEPRLVLVLLEEPSQLPLDAELLAYISGNTYVRWGDPWFWQKLRSALPGPSALHAAEAAAASLPPVPEPGSSGA